MVYKLGDSSLRAHMRVSSAGFMKKFARVYIEISNICNLSCDFCPEVERKKRLMPLALFRSILLQLKDLTDEVTFHLMGEPLTHPHLAEFVQTCGEVGMPVNLTTNGTLLNHKNYGDVILSSIVRQVNFSLQSWAANFPDRDVSNYLQNIFTWTKRALVERPDLYVNFRLWNMGTNEGNEERNQTLLRPITEAFGFELKTPLDVGFRKSRRIDGRLYLHFDSRFQWPSMRNEIQAEKGFCYGLRSHFAIHSDGTVVPCCLDKEAGIPLGQVSADEPVEALSLLRALQSGRALSLREGFDQFELREALCQRCSYIRRFDSKMRNIKLQNRPMGIV